MSIRNVAKNTGDAIEQTARGAANQASPWVQRLARLGYAAKGVIYIIIGMLALQAAFGPGGKTTDTRGALHTIATDGTGRFLLGIVALGLVGYALWRFVQAFFDPERKSEGQGIKGVVMRVGCFISGVIHAGLALTAFRLLTGVRGGGDGGGGTEAATATALSQPLGQFWVLLAGVVVLGSAAYQVYKGWKEKFLRDLHTEAMNQAEMKAATVTGKVGLIARGIAFAIVGWFLLRAGFSGDAGEARGLDGALVALAQQPYGPILLGLVAAGLVAYGGYCFVQSRWRHVPAVAPAPAAA